MWPMTTHHCNNGGPWITKVMEDQRSLRWWRIRDHYGDGEPEITTVMEDQRSLWWWRTRDHYGDGGPEITMVMENQRSLWWWRTRDHYGDGGPEITKVMEDQRSLRWWRTMIIQRLFQIRKDKREFVGKKKHLKMWLGRWLQSWGAVRGLLKNTNPEREGPSKKVSY